MGRSLDLHACVSVLVCSVLAAALEGPAAERAGGGAGHRAAARPPVLLARVARGRTRPRGARHRPRLPRLARRPPPLRVRPLPRLRSRTPIATRAVLLSNVLTLHQFLPLLVVLVKGESRLR